MDSRENDSEIAEKHEYMKEEKPNMGTGNTEI
jgi:hypothetical protein